MQRKYLQLIHHNNEDTFAIYEAILDTDTNFTVWIADTPLPGCTYNSYKQAVWQWCLRDKKYSSLMDILDNEQYLELLKEFEEKELIF